MYTKLILRETAARAKVRCVCLLRTNEKERDTCIRIFIFSSLRVVKRRLYRDEMEEVRTSDFDCFRVIDRNSRGA